MKMSLTFLIILILQIWKSELSPILPKSRQFLQPLPGYIPVYIRPGNTPLEDINLDLAEAFRSYAIKQGRINSERSTNFFLEKNDDLSSVDLNNILQSEDEITKTAKDGLINVIVGSNIQKIPKSP